MLINRELNKRGLLYIPFVLSFSFSFFSVFIYKQTTILWCILPKNFCIYLFIWLPLLLHLPQPNTWINKTFLLKNSLDRFFVVFWKGKTNLFNIFFQNITFRKKQFLKTTVYRFFVVLVKKQQWQRLFLHSKLQSSDSKQLHGFCDLTWRNHVLTPLEFFNYTHSNGSQSYYKSFESELNQSNYF